MNKKKALTSGVAVLATVGVLFGGTFAWQSISQTALNEVAASVNPGGRLHDDFVEITYDKEGNKRYTTMTYNKDVYAENFTEMSKNGVQVYARVRLDEYMELGANAGKLNEEGKKDASNKAKSIVAGAELDNKATWTTHVMGAENDPFHEYWTWKLGGKTVYMPTFNKNKDSKEADINGSFAVNFSDHVDYAVGDKNGGVDGQVYAIYDVDADPDGKTETDELADAGIKADTVIKEGANALEGVLTDWDKRISIEQETHEAKETIDGTIMSMADYMERLNDADDPFDGKGNFWVCDDDGWAYWAMPIDPETATGLLLDGISRTDTIINQDWYYAINVVAQFITGDDMGQDDNTGFYDISEGTAPTADALALLSAIGVDVPTGDVASEEELTEALKLGGVVNVTKDIDLTDNLTVSTGTVLNLGDHTLTTTANVWANSKEECAMIYVDGATLTINGGSFEARKNDAFAVSVGNGGKVVINNGTFKGNYTAVYVHEGEAVINGGNFSIQQAYTELGKEYNYVLNCYNENYENGTAKITVYGGSFENFDPASKTAGDDGSFVAPGYVTNENNGWYTVTAATAEN